MPKNTFFNLEDEKRDKIIEAAKAEFTAHPLRKSRVSNIIKEADIPRGSFYQYFEDLDDLYFYVVDEVFDNIHKAGTIFCESTNDLFEFSQITFEYDYNAFINDMRHEFMKNVFKSIASNQEYVDSFKKMRKEYIMGILNKMDLSKIKFKEEADLIKMYQMIQDLKRNVIHKSIIDNLDKEQAYSEFGWYINIIKNGLLEEE